MQHFDSTTYTYRELCVKSLVGCLWKVGEMLVERRRIQEDFSPFTCDFIWSHSHFTIPFNITILCRCLFPPPHRILRFHSFDVLNSLDFLSTLRSFVLSISVITPNSDHSDRLRHFSFNRLERQRKDWKCRLGFWIWTFGAVDHLLYMAMQTHAMW